MDSVTEANAPKNEFTFEISLLKADSEDILLVVCMHARYWKQLAAGTPALYYLKSSSCCVQCEENRFAQPQLPRQCNAHKHISQYFDRQVLTGDFWKSRFQQQELYVKGSLANPVVAVLDTCAFGSVVQAALGMQEGRSLSAMKSGVGRASRSPFQEYLDGYSLIISTADRFHPAFAQLSRELAEKYFYHVFCVFYLTPPHAWARRAHNDDQDVCWFVNSWASKSTKSDDHILPPA